VSDRHSGLCYFDTIQFTHSIGLGPPYHRRRSRTSVRNKRAPKRIALPNRDTDQLHWRRKRLTQPAPDPGRQRLGAGLKESIPKDLNHVVQVLLVERAPNEPLEEVIQRRKIHDKAIHRIGRSRDHHLHAEIMGVRGSQRTKGPGIGLGAPVLSAVGMRGAKADDTMEIKRGHRGRMDRVDGFRLLYRARDNFAPLSPECSMASSLTPFFNPKGIAVIGANRRPGTIGWQIVDNLLRHGFHGAVYPVNPAARAIHSIPAWRSVLEIPGDVDLAVIVVSKELVLDMVEDCAARGIRNVVVISAGFRETGAEGAERERQLVERIRALGMRLVGPNCMGVLSTEPDISMNATFAPTMPPAGQVSFLSQSGALGVTILDYAAEYGIGIRHFISVGNKPEVSGNDLLEYWESDPDTRVILMYLETFGNPRKFTRIARRVARKKPIIVVKSGRSRAGARAASSHTGALSGWDAAADALLAQCGVLRANSVEELFDLAMAFGTLPLPRGKRVAILTNAGGPGIMIADAFESEGLEVAEFSEATLEGLRALFPEEASVRNPVDMIASATPESYQKALSLVLQDEGVDAVIAAFVPPLGVRQQQVAEAIIAGARTRPDRPVLAVLMGREGLPTARPELRAAGIPAYIFPESAARALGALHRYARWQERPVQAPSRFPVDAPRVTRILDQAQAEGRTRLLETEGYAILEAYGIPVVPHTLAEDPEAAVAAFHALGGRPAVLKVVSPDVSHKTEMGGVLLDLRTEAEVRDGWVTLRERLATHAPDATLSGILVSPLAEDGREMILGMSLDPSFGPLLVFGLGGIYVETFKDVALRVPPVTALEAHEMIRELRSFPLLQGVRGEAPTPLEPVVEAIQRLSQLVLDHDRLAGIDINPLLAGETGVMALDARVLLQTPGAISSRSAPWMARSASSP